MDGIGLRSVHCKLKHPGASPVKSVSRSGQHAPNKSISKTRLIVDDMIGIIATTRESLQQIGEDVHVTSTTPWQPRR